MRIVVKDRRIEGFCEVKGFRGEMSVILFMKNLDEWTVGCSMCLPSDIVAARQVQECVAEAFNELSKLA